MYLFGFHLRLKYGNSRNHFLFEPCSYGGRLTRTTYFTSAFENTQKEKVFVRSAVRDLRQGFRYRKSTKKDMSLVNTTTCNRIFEKRKFYLLFHNYFF